MRTHRWPWQRVKTGAVNKLVAAPVASYPGPAPVLTTSRPKNHGGGEQVENEEQNSVSATRYRDDFGYPVTGGQVPGTPAWEALNAYRERNAAVAKWVEETKFTGDGAYGAFTKANPTWTTKYNVPSGPSAGSRS